MTDDATRAVLHHAAGLRLVRLALEYGDAESTEMLWVTLQAAEAEIRRALVACEAAPRPMVVPMRGRRRG
jgi:hypothetical protein